VSLSSSVPKAWGLKVCRMQSKKTRRIVKSRRYLVKRKVKYLLLAVAAFALVGVLAYSVLRPISPIDSTPKIAIVDHLASQWPDQSFNQTSQAILNQTGLKVDYYPPEEVTVDFYRDLPKHNYKLIIFRVHSTATSDVNGTPPFVVFFTSELYNHVAHVSEQADMRVVMVKFPNDEATYFGVTPLFVKDSMEGRFNDTVIIAMGCEGLKQNTMAEAFIEKGAKAYISWNGTVSASHTDDATVSLLRHLITEKQTVEEAVTQTMREVGPDPTDNSILVFYPDKAGSSLLLSNTTVAAPAVTPAKRKNSRIDGNSGTTLVPPISTL
jgi:hypothetical protein